MIPKGWKVTWEDGLWFVSAPNPALPSTPIVSAWSGDIALPEVIKMVRREFGIA